MKKLLTRIILSAAIASGATSVQAQDIAPATQPHGYIVATYDITDQAMFDKYMAAAPLSLLDKYHGKMLVFNMSVKGVEGQPRSVFGMVEFPSLADAKRFYYSPEYTAARQLRIKSTKGNVIFLEGMAK